MPINTIYLVFLKDKIS